uniref:C-type lectin domain-containing protein n=1 Tax=Acrobeloides nanus TaxID=290746 RepID=A0A914C393_9BILA
MVNLFLCLVLFLLIQVEASINRNRQDQPCAVEPGQQSRDGIVPRHVETNQLSHQSPSIPSSATPSYESILRPFRENMTTELHNRIRALEARFNHELKVMENRLSTKIDDVKRKDENEIKKLSKTIKILSSPVYHFQGKEYIYVDEPESWYDAEANCQRWRGHLVSINSESENNFIKQLHSWYVWIGLNDIAKEDRFEWVDSGKITFQLWKTGQPDNQETNENCTEQDKYGQWSDKFCFLSRHYVCERALRNQTSPH